MKKTYNVVHNGFSNIKPKKLNKYKRLKLEML